MRSMPTALRRRRQLAGYTAAGLAREAGVSASRVRELEQAARPLLPPTAARLAKALGCGIEDIATLDDAAAPNSGDDGAEAA